MIKVYCGKLIEDKMIDIPLLLPLFKNTIRKNEFFFQIAAGYIQEQIFDFVDSVADADFLLLPYNYFDARLHKTYFNYFLDLAKQSGKRVIVFDYSDFHEEVVIPHAIVFRTSLYRSDDRKNEYSVSPFVEDLSDTVGLIIRHKGDRVKPVISFCGWASNATKIAALKVLFRNLFWNLRSLFTMNRFLLFRKKGLYFRINVISKLFKSNKIISNFIIRKTYSGHKKTIGMDYEQARKEYVSNMLDSDFVLTIKGDGNYSQRFFEALSVGRIPLFIDTDSVLPCEDIIDYNKFILRVDYSRLKDLDSIVSDFFRNLSEDEFVEMQQAAFIAFKEHLRVDAFIRHIVEILKKNKY